MGITFITLRRRSLLAPQIALTCRHRPGAPSPSTYRVASIAPRASTRPRCASHERDFRQFFITDLGHDEPTILLTNDAKSTAKTKLITRYAKRMLIENALSDAVRFFHIDALSSSVGFKVDFDMALLVIASGLYRLMARRMRGYDDAQARQIFRDLVDMPADVTISQARSPCASIVAPTCPSSSPRAAHRQTRHGPVVERRHPCASSTERPTGPNS